MKGYFLTSKEYFLVTEGYFLFVGKIFQKYSDWNFLCALNEIENLNAESLRKIRSRVNWSSASISSQSFWRHLEMYSSLTRLNANLILPECCQLCGEADIATILQLFSNEGFAYQTLINEDEENDKERKNTEEKEPEKIDILTPTTDNEELPAIVSFQFCNLCFK